MVDCIDNAALYVYVALASCHYEGNTTYAGPHIAKLTGKDERAVRGHLTSADMVVPHILSKVGIRSLEVSE